MELVVGHSVWSGVDAEEKQTAWFGARFFFSVFLSLDVLNVLTPQKLALSQHEKK